MNKENYYKKRAFQLLQSKAVLFTFLVISCNSEAETEEIDHSNISSVVDSTVNTNPIPLEGSDSISIEDSYSYVTQFNEEQGWGYQILKGSKVYINQPHVPAISGNKGFSNELDAKKTAEFALYKINNGIMPPTLSKLELDSLGVLDIKE